MVLQQAFQGVNRAACTTKPYVWHLANGSERSQGDQGYSRSFAQAQAIIHVCTEALCERGNWRTCPLKMRSAYADARQVVLEGLGP